MTFTAEVSYVAGGHSGRLVTITTKVSYATGGHSGRLWPSLLMFRMPLEVIPEVSGHHC